MNDLLLRACRREPVPRPPVWLMRQAGRYLPEYRAIRARHDFLTMVRTPELAAEITLQPLDILDVDGAIIFSDILVIPDVMGMPLSVNDGTGPVFERPLRNPGDIERLLPFDPPAWHLEAIRLTRRQLDDRVPLIGFAGAPWTLASYMVEGAGSKEWRSIKRFMAETPEATHQLLERLSDAVTRSLSAQIEAGAQVIQVFESCAGGLSPRDFAEFALPYLTRVAESVRGRGAPLIIFAPGAGWALEIIARATRAEVMGIDWHTRPSEARAGLAGLDVACQGNFDPAWLYTAPPVIHQRVQEMVSEFGITGYIANLGHGVLRDTPVEHVKAFVEAVKQVESSNIPSQTGFRLPDTAEQP